MKCESLSFVAVSRFRLPAAVLLSLLLASCGSHQGGTQTPAKTGAVSFTVEWEPPPEGYVPGGAAPLSLRPMAPVIDVCTDYGIGTITMQVLSPVGVDNVLAEGSNPCSNHTLTLNNVPAASNLTMRLMGTVQGAGNDWTGFSAPFTLSPGETKDVGKVTMSYTGNDITPPAIFSVVPVDNASHVRDNAAIQVVFSERMAPNTVIDNEAIVVIDNLSTRIPGTITYSLADNSATFHPSGRMTSGARHTVTVRSTVTDMAGLNLVNPFLWEFDVHSKGNWMDPLLLESDPGDVVGKSLAIDGNDNAIVVWEQSDGLRGNIWTSRYSILENRWSPPVLIETEGFDASGPKVAADVQGNAVAVWTQTDGTGYNVWANRYSATQGKWGNAEMIERINNPENSQGVQVAVDETGNAIAVWSQPNGVTYSNIWSQKYTAATNSWDSSQLNLDNNAGYARDPNLAMNRVGEAAAAWQQYDGIRYNAWVRLRTKSAFGGYTWQSSPTLLETAAGEAYSPAVAVDGSGNVFAVWSQSDGSRYHIYAKRYSAVTKTWSGAGLLESNNTYNTFNVRIAANTGGDAAAIWDLYSSPNTIWVARFVAAESAWKTPVQIDSDGYASSIAIDEDGNIIVGVTKGVVKPEAVRNGVFARRYSAASATWEPLVRIEDNPGSNSFPQVAMDGNGNALAVFIQNDAPHPELPGHINLWVNRYE